MATQIGRQATVLQSVCMAILMAAPVCANYEVVIRRITGYSQAALVSNTIRVQVEAGGGTVPYTFTSGWTKEGDGTSAYRDFTTGTVALLEVSCTVTDACGATASITPVNLCWIDVKKPVADGKYLMKSTSATHHALVEDIDVDVPQNCGITCWATMTLNDEAVRGESVEFNPLAATHPIPLVFQTLPTHNSSWGLNTGTSGFCLQLARNGANAGWVELPLKCYFTIGDKYLDGSTFAGDTPCPNWYYFWHKGNVVPSIRDTVYRSNGGSAGGGYDTEHDVIILYDGATTMSKYSISVKNRYYNTSIETGTDGILDTPVSSSDNNLYDIEAGHGIPHTTCVVPGNSGILINSVLEGDDSFVKDINGNNVAVETGNNGICETQAAYPDIYMIYPTSGEEGTVVTSDIDGWLDSYDSSDGTYSIHPQDVLIEFMTITLVFQYEHAIDCAAMVIAHEKRHQTNRKECGADNDNDGIDDSAYEELHLCPTRPDTYDMFGTFKANEYKSCGDSEVVARYLNEKDYYSAGSDWSENGKNW